MASKKTVAFITGKLKWCKILGDPVLNYQKDGREWTFEIELNDKAIDLLKKHDLADRIKGKGFNIGTKGQFVEREPFLRLKKTEFNRDGNPNPPIRVYDADEKEWDHETLIGNDSVADVKLDIRDYGAGRKSGIYPAAIRIKELVEYEASEFGGMDEEADEAPRKVKAKAKDTFREDFGLDDEIPL